MDREVHEEITEQVLADNGFSVASIAVVKSSNTRQDEIPYEAWRHFDRTPETNDVGAFDSGIRHFRTELDRAVEDLGKGQTVSALEGVGRVFHAIQDFCSHSNFIELPEALQQQIRLSFLNSDQIASSELRLTGFDPRRWSESPVGDPYPHSLNSKDTPNSPLHNQAKLAAASLCRDVLTMIRGKISANQWNALKTCSGY